ncbi:MAG: winged helix-turn-helix transcriptional regulator [Alphaproteobacteria bacterium]|nr:winged helix-turn-helix transcriptional regulator [Alphaproteobacteria bacterium]
MKRSGLDKIDRNILKELQEDGRITNVKLAESVGMSAPPCLRRVRALEDAGYIEGYHADINHAAMGYGVIVFAMVKLKSQAEEDLNAFDKFINELEVVRECYMLTGDFDFVLKIVAKNWEDYQSIFTTKLSRAPNVSSIKSSLSVRTSKRLPGIPID